MNLSTIRVVYWVNVSESFNAGSHGLSRINGPLVKQLLLGKRKTYEDLEDA